MRRLPAPSSPAPLLAAAALAFVGCYASHVVESDARLDAGVDAFVRVDAGPSECVTPRGGHCCCQGDELGSLSCVRGAWRCEADYGYFVGAECAPTCGGPCSLPCPPPMDIACDAFPPVFPTFERGCRGAEDCVIVAHQTDCCGSILYTGIASHERGRFEAAEAVCASQYPDCMCIGGETADDGTTPASGPEPYVECNAGVCTTSYFVGG